MGLRSQRLSQAQAGEGELELRWQRPALGKDGGRKRRKAAVDLDLEQLPGDWIDGVGWGRKSQRKKKSLNRDQETLY